MTRGRRPRPVPGPVRWPVRALACGLVGCLAWGLPAAADSMEDMHGDRLDSPGMDSDWRNRDAVPSDRAHVPVMRTTEGLVPVIGGEDPVPRAPEGTVPVIAETPVPTVRETR